MDALAEIDDHLQADRERSCPPLLDQKGASRFCTNSSPSDKTPTLAVAFAEVLLAFTAIINSFAHVQAAKTSADCLLAGNSAFVSSHPYTMARALATLRIATLLLASGGCHARSLSSPAGDHAIAFVAYLTSHCRLLRMNCSTNQPPPRGMETVRTSLQLSAGCGSVSSVKVLLNCHICTRVLRHHKLLPVQVAGSSPSVP